MAELSDAPMQRRTFVKLSGAGGAALVFGVNLSGCDYLPGGDDPLRWNAFVRVQPDGKVRLTVGRSEMGQGVRTSCAMLLAEELDVDWNDVIVEQADGDPMYGDQNTDGSKSIRSQWGVLREVGAAARAAIVGAAAREWDVDVSECSTEAGVVIHAASGRTAEYVDLLGAAQRIAIPDDVPLKARDGFRLIGHATIGVDVEDITTGRAVYGGDVVLPGMVYASIERSPTPRGTLASLDDSAARAVPGVIDVVHLPRDGSGLTNESVAVVARDTWSAFKGRRALQVEWNRAESETENTADYRERLHSLSLEPGRVVREEGDATSDLSGVEGVVEATYHAPYLVHTPMEPPALVAWLHDGQCEIWAPTQAPQWARWQVSQALQMGEGRVTIHVTLLGGGFGRKSKPDFIVEAAHLARRVNAPVKIQWTREDEVRHGFYRAESVQYLRARVGEDGRPSSWFHRTVFPGIGWGFQEGGDPPGSGELSQGFTTMPYRIPNVRLEAGRIPSNLRIGWLRSVCNTFHAWAVNGFVDELAAEANADPVEYQLALLGEPRVFGDSSGPRAYQFDTGRLSNVIRVAANSAGWNGVRPPKGRNEGWGFAAHRSFLTYVAMAMKVSVEGDNVRVREVHCAVDCGTVVNPDTIEAQMQGATVFGLTAALYGEITTENGVVEQSNFHDYPMLRMPEMPHVTVSIVESDELPTGIGEPGVPPVAPALCNAIFDATGERIRDLPVVRG